MAAAQLVSACVCRGEGVVRNINVKMLGVGQTVSVGGGGRGGKVWLSGPSKDEGDGRLVGVHAGRVGQEAPGMAQGGV